MPTNSTPLGATMENLRFDAGDMTLMVACAMGQSPRVIYWGHRLSAGVHVDDVFLLATDQGAHGSENVPVTASLSMEPGGGLMGPSGLSAHRDGRDWGSRFVVQSVTHQASGAIIHCADSKTRLGMVYHIDCDSITGILRLSSTLTNLGDGSVDLVDMATMALPVPAHLTDIIGFTGRWSGEFQRERLGRFTGSYVRENRRGRASHDSFPALILCDPHTTESQGEAYGLHLAWSGNHRLSVHTLADGRVFALMGALLFPGEIRLGPGEHYHSPEIVAGYSAHGFSALSQNFHAHVRSKLLRASTRLKPRPVHYNTWESVYFDHDLARLKTLATRAAAIGVERFVLDDGWFGSRRHDRAGLGDWHVSSDVYPEGLTPLIDHVTGLGMEMGIWFEPEMVNPDSDLFRAHPDWILQIAGTEQVPFRNQYVLDVSRAEVADYLFVQIDAILAAHNIGYVKWDMNRDLNHPGDATGRPRAHAQVAAVYALMDRLRARHPTVEIESCASGGARADFGILAHTDRVWTSDSNDALDRQAIQRGASFFLPLDVMGSHVGPRHCHITGRSLSMAMRAGTALMGHMGLELNLLEEPAHELEELQAGIELYKKHRQLLHNGNFFRLETPHYLNAVGVVAADQNEALFSVAFLTGHPRIKPDTIYFPGLNPALDYRIKLVWPQNWKTIVAPSITEALDLAGGGHVFSGEALMVAGLRLPMAFPETVLLFHLCVANQKTRK
jgi:alpha-galactosidase